MRRRPSPGPVASCARPDWVASARREVEGFFAWQLIGGHLHALNPLPLVQGQQAYGVNCHVQAALECYRATGEDALRAAGRAARLLVHGQ